MPFSYAPLPYYPETRVTEIIGRMQPIRTMHVRTDIDDRIEQNLSTLLANRAQNLQDPGSREKMGLVIYGDSGAGKSRLIDRHIVPHPKLYNATEADKQFISLRLKSPVRLRSAGFQTVRALGYKTINFNEKKDYWPTADSMIHELGTVAIHYDEVHDIFISATASDARQILSTMKGLMDRPDHPVILILTGTYELKRRMQSAETNRRFLPVTIPPVDVESDLDAVIEQVNAFCEKAGLINCLEEEDYLRLVHSADNQLGLTFARAMDGIEEALLAGEDTLRRMNLAHAYHRNMDREEELNVFVVDNYRMLRPTMHEDEPEVDEEIRPKRKAPKREKTNY